MQTLSVLFPVVDAFQGYSYFPQRVASTALYSREAEIRRKIAQLRREGRLKRNADGDNDAESQLSPDCEVATAVAVVAENANERKRQFIMSIGHFFIRTYLGFYLSGINIIKEDKETVSEKNSDY